MRPSPNKNIGSKKGRITVLMEQISKEKSHIKLQTRLETLLKVIKTSGIDSQAQGWAILNGTKHFVSLDGLLMQ